MLRRLLARLSKIRRVEEIPDAITNIEEFYNKIKKKVGRKYKGLLIVEYNPRLDDYRVFIATQPRSYEKSVGYGLKDKLERTRPATKYALHSMLEPIVDYLAVQLGAMPYKRIMETGDGFAYVVLFKR